MSNVHRYRYGDQELISVSVDDTTVVEIGDFMVLVSAADEADDATLTENKCCPSDYMVDVGDAAANRALLATQFLGIAMSASLNGDTDDILIATKGFFELDQATAAAIAVGDGVEGYSDGTTAAAQTVVAGATSPIAVCVKNKTSTSLTRVLCRLIPSALMDDLGHA